MPKKSNNKKPKRKKKKKQIGFLATDDMVDFLNNRAAIAGNRSEYIRHLILHDMFGGGGKYQPPKQHSNSQPTDAIQKAKMEVYNELKAVLDDRKRKLEEGIQNEESEENDDIEG